MAVTPLCTAEAAEGHDCVDPDPIWKSSEKASAAFSVAWPARSPLQLALLAAPAAAVAVRPAISAGYPRLWTAALAALRLLNVPVFCEFGLFV